MSLFDSPSGRPQGRASALHQGRAQQPTRRAGGRAAALHQGRPAPAAASSGRAAAATSVVLSSADTEVYSPWILQPDPDTGNYHFTRPVAYLLSLVSGVSLTAVSTVVVQSRKMGQYRPFYSAYKGGGGITIGTTSYKTITYTENFFRAQPAFNGHGYAHDIRTWLSISAHEVGHLPQIDRAGGLLPYLGGFIKQYATTGSHDAAPLEAEAERGSIMFEKFYRFTTQRNGTNAVENLLSAPTYADSTKIGRIREWWRIFQQHTASKTGSAPAIRPPSSRLPR